MSKLSTDNPELFWQINNSGVIPEELIEKYPTLHFCIEWDFLLIEEGMEEFECCLCLKHEGLTKNE